MTLVVACGVPDLFVPPRVPGLQHTPECCVGRWGVPRMESASSIPLPPWLGLDALALGRVLQLCLPVGVLAKVLWFMNKK